MKVVAPPAAVCAVALCLSTSSEAHKGVTAKFTYNAEVFPIFLNRCGHCHVEGGVGPMSLVTYEEAFPWAESLRTELLDTEDREAPADFVATAHRDIPARELDVILDWATGGTPEGDRAAAPPSVTLRNEWTHGPPTVEQPLPVPYEMPGSLMETTQEFVLTMSVGEPRMLNAIDIRPGNPAIVREVALLVGEPGGTPRMAGTWTPRQNPAPVVLTPALRIIPGSTLVARFHYKKTWKYEGQPMTDRSTLGLYFAR